MLGYPGYPPVHGNLNKSNIRLLKTPPANAARLTRIAAIFVIVQVGFCPPHFIQHRQPMGSKQQEFANSRIPAVLPRKTTIRNSNDDNGNVTDDGTDDGADDDDNDDDNDDDKEDDDNSLYNGNTILQSQH